MPFAGLMLILGTVFGIISSIVVYGWDWRRVTIENNQIKRINIELVRTLKEERAKRVIEEQE